MDGKFVLEQIDVDGVETLGLPVREIKLCFGIREIGNQGLRGIALNAEWFVVLIDKIAAIFRHFERIGVGCAGNCLLRGRERRDDVCA